MWDYDSLLGKARVYFARGEQHPKSDDEFALWLLLGLEFLLRAPLARIHPTLLAEPTGDAILYAAGVPTAPDIRELKSIPARTVISRLGKVVEDFTAERQSDAAILIGLRNQELHTGIGALAIDTSKWLPRFTRIVDIVCEHLELDPTDLLGKDVVAQGRALVDAEDKKLDYEIRKRIDRAADFYRQLAPDEIEVRRSRIARTPEDQFRELTRLGIMVTEAIPIVVNPELVDCPACHEKIPIRLQPVRRTNEGFEDDEFYHDVIYVAVGLVCPVCGLELRSTGEIRSAGLRQEYTRRERESLEEMSQNYFEPDYGND